MSTNLDVFFRPRGVAVIGASRDPQKLGHGVVRNLVNYGYDGPIYPINPFANSILDRRAYPSIFDAPDPLDLAVLIVPATKVPHELDQSGGADIIPGSLRVDITNHWIRRAHIGAQNLDQFLVGSALIEEFRDRDEEAFFVDRAGVGREPDSSDVEHMARVAKIPDERVIEKHRRDHREVVEMPRRLLGIVGDQHIAWSKGFSREDGQKVMDAGCHRVDMAGCSGNRLSNHVAAGIEDARRKITGFADNRREARSHQRRGLLVDDRDQPIPHDFQSDRIERFCHRVLPIFYRRPLAAILTGMHSGSQHKQKRNRTVRFRSVDAIT